MPLIKSDAWKALRKRHGLEKHAVKASVGSKLDDYHKAKTTKDKLKTILAVKTALVKYKTELDKRDHAAFLTDVDKLIKDVDDRTRKLGQREEDSKSLDTLTVKAVLGGGQYTANFKTFAKVSHVDECVDFLIVSAKSPKGSAAKKIYETFISARGKRPVNIDDGVRSVLDNQAAQSDWDNMDFKPARHVIEALLQQDTLPKFVKRMKEILADMED